jgi:hypothetical protein
MRRFCQSDVPGLQRLEFGSEREREREREKCLLLCYCGMAEVT